MKPTAIIYTIDVFQARNNKWVTRTDFGQFKSLRQAKTKIRQYQSSYPNLKVRISAT